MNQNQITIIGGGLSGLIAAYLLAKNGKEVLLIEKKSYPFHRVCGEYISNEVRDFLINENLFPSCFNPAEINTFRLTAVNGALAEVPLDLGGFGISRYSFDHFLYQKCQEVGVKFLLKTQVATIDYIPKKKAFDLSTNHGERLVSPIVLAAYGKRSKIDKYLKRPYLKQRSPYIGIKHHIKITQADHIVALHNYEGGYLGINRVENEHFNLCYLGSRAQLKAAGNIPAMEEQYLFKNPHIKAIYEGAEFLWEKPEVINEISFATKSPVENQVIMIGDAAGMITPLCGNGMAIAIHSGKLAAEAILKHKNLKTVQEEYTKAWNYFFYSRLRTGRAVQRLFGAPLVSKIAVNVLKKSPFLAKKLILQTHGDPIR
ncbi:NAD(P)/FAD-dependent oxidoreductase [Cyclobacterium sp. 1_MG-2023]|uniref:NAD(P)/FAD-dependent oxidoreductase n=1 Tax=Cyclobacterium sp. 1_MG-2023 TaxID=3062681 RepID=UPI0026E45985|nr:NAD(P)/FAD-dependent oxidoreductase [Cyclobacterium sp. 1_MG-2023]MDO6440026.1 NAD(P)/FAD-dependent oxidoreductase [Cyclobacterium sp. 1_MG-2023]